MGNNNIIVNENGIKYNFYADVKPQSQNVVQQTISEVYENSCKNLKFFDGLKLNVLTSWRDSKECRNLSDYQFGFTAYPVVNGGKSIYIRTKEEPVYNSILLNNSINPSQIKETTLHELGHVFDYYFASPDRIVANRLWDMLHTNKTPSKDDIEEMNVLFAKYKTQNGLSDSDKYKQAWKEDLEREFKGQNNVQSIIKRDKLGYFSPTYDYGTSDYQKIKLKDGINDEELILADRNREEVFAQLFAYAMGAEADTTEKNNVINTYRNSYEVVKEFINEYLGINISSKGSRSLDTKM